MRGESSIRLERVSKEHFLKSVWVRAWNHRGRHKLGMRRQLRTVRVLSGFGLDDPYEIRLERSRLSSRTVADGITLQEALAKGPIPRNESFVRGLLEQLFLGLARLPKNHGYICPETIRISPDGTATLWAVPTLAWDYSEAAPKSYRAPERYLTEKSDIYSLCRIGLELLGSQTTAALQAGLNQDPASRPTLLGLARALNPDTVLADVNIKRGLEARQEGLKYYNQGELRRAEVAWQEAKLADRLSSTVWNNLAVVKMARGEFEGAVFDLQQAFELSTSHPIISSNIAFCMLQLHELEAAEFWARQANHMNPSLSQPYLCLALLCAARGLLELAASHAYESVAKAPRSPAARIQLAQVYDKMGASGNALVQWRRVARMPKTAPFQDHLIDELAEPPWGKIRTSYGNLSLALQPV